MIDEDMAADLQAMDDSERGRHLQSVAARQAVVLDLPDVCLHCGGPAWVEHTGSVMPGIGVPCDCVDEAKIERAG